ncbi:MAG: helix-turn-helix transcriptional regulator [Parasporobacterium sp.]|nr:helix-turn-helix transcriptional regulator [Parasporobacterium sp.]
MNIGDRIRAKRIELGMTQDELAKKVGYSSKTAISKIESGERDLKQTKIRLLADALETTTDYIMGWDDEEEIYNDFVNQIKKLSPDEFSEIKDYMNYIISKRK